MIIYTMPVLSKEKMDEFLAKFKLAIQTWQTIRDDYNNKVIDLKKYQEGLEAFHKAQQEFGRNVYTVLPDTP